MKQVTGLCRNANKLPNTQFVIKLIGTRAYTHARPFYQCHTFTYFSFTINQNILLSVASLLTMD